jgi:hypothetical protein
LEVSYKNEEGDWVDVQNTTSKRYLVLDPWNPQTKQLTKDNVKLLVNRNELQYPWEGKPDRTAQYQKQIVPHRVNLLPVEVNCPELYMFGGHKNDVVELCKVSGITCQWKLKDLSPVIGTFDHPTDSACSFTATAPGKNIIQLLIGGNVVWEKPTEILRIKSRADWGAVAAKTHTQTMPTIQNITLHHTSNTGTGWAEMQRIQNLHMSLFPYNLFGGKDFDDIGYHLIMDKNGDVFEGRKIEGAPGLLGGPYAKGEHVGSNNTVAGFGLCTMGDYEASEGNEAWPAARQKSIEKVISAVCRRHKLTKDKISYHKAMALSSSPSSCPGSNYIPAIPDIIKHVEENLR